MPAEVIPLARGAGPPTGPEGLVRAAVRRDGACCTICGRNVGPLDAWRRNEAPPSGASASDFSAMCREHVAFLRGEGALPGRYIAHGYEPGRVGWLVTRLAVYAYAAGCVTFYLAFAVLSVLVVFVWVPREPGPASAVFMLSGLVLAVGFYVAAAVWRFARDAWAALAASWRAIARGVVYRSGGDG